MLSLGIAAPVAKSGMLLNTCEHIERIDQNLIGVGDRDSSVMGGLHLSLRADNGRNGDLQERGELPNGPQVYGKYEDIEQKHESPSSQPPHHQVEE